MVAVHMIVCPPLFEGIATEVIDVSWNGKKLRKICVIF